MRLFERLARRNALPDGWPKGFPTGNEVRGPVYDLDGVARFAYSGGAEGLDLGGLPVVEPPGAAGRFLADFRVPDFVRERAAFELREGALAGRQEWGETVDWDPDRPAFFGCSVRPVDEGSVGLRPIARETCLEWGSLSDIARVYEATVVAAAGYRWLFAVDGRVRAAGPARLDVEGVADLAELPEAGRQAWLSAGVAALSPVVFAFALLGCENVAAAEASDAEGVLRGGRLVPEIRPLFETGSGAWRLGPKTDLPPPGRFVWLAEGEAEGGTAGTYWAAGPASEEEAPG